MKTVNDVTTLNPHNVLMVFSPKSQQELIEFIKRNHEQNIQADYSVAGGRFSMGGQSSVEGTINIDMTGLNKIVNFSPKEKIITLETGCIWRNVQELIDKENLSIKIMQTYSNFTIGGSLSVNVHGRYIGLGPIILSVNKIKVLFVDGTTIEASPIKNSEIFFACIGCYRAIGIILEVELQLTDNIKVKQKNQRMEFNNYLDFFKSKIRDNPNIIYHNADIYPNQYTKVNAVSWFTTNENVTVKDRLIPKSGTYLTHRYFIWAFTETILGKERRRAIYDPLIYNKKRVFYRNYEASYDANELNPNSRKTKTYVLQEYFVPLEKN